MVLFDPEKDVAVLYVPGPEGARCCASTTAPTRGDSAVVAGYPQDGDLNLQAATVANRVRATGQNIYSDATVTREIYSIRSTVRPGNSGGPLLTTDGKVYGVVFARSTSDDETGYVLTVAEVAADARARGERDGAGGHGRPGHVLRHAGPAGRPSGVTARCAADATPGSEARPMSTSSTYSPSSRNSSGRTPSTTKPSDSYSLRAGALCPRTRRVRRRAPLPAGLLDGRADQGPADAAAARLVGDGEALDLPDMRVRRRARSGSRAGHSRRCGAVELRDQMVLGGVTAR